jgi:LPXTG-motif cell wall-anchored protein
MTGGYEIGLSGSAASAAELTGDYGGHGDEFITTGGGKQTQTLFIVVGLVALAVVILLFFRR